MAKLQHTVRIRQRRAGVIPAFSEIRGQKSKSQIKMQKLGGDKTGLAMTEGFWG